MRNLSVLFVLAVAGPLWAAPPVDVPTEVKGEPGAFVTLRAKTDGAVVRFVALDAGLNVFPSDLLTDRKATVVSSPKVGRYRVLAYSSVKDDPTEPAIVTVVIGDAAPAPPPDKPTDPPVTPPAGSLYFLIVRKDGPAEPAFTRTMSLPAWDELRTKGHQVKDKTVSAAKQDVGLDLPAGTQLPVVVTLSVAGGASRVVRDAIPLPASPDSILKLPVLK